MLEIAVYFKYCNLRAELIIPLLLSVACPSTHHSSSACFLYCFLRSCSPYLPVPFFYCLVCFNICFSITIIYSHAKNDLQSRSLIEIITMLCYYRTLSCDVTHTKLVHSHHLGVQHRNYSERYCTPVQSQKSPLFIASYISVGQLYTNQTKPKSRQPSGYICVK